uniref:Cytochrome c oxidase subunit 3 n=1 Tax=Tamerlania zarudnyi TaxID=138578 RepID=A0A894JKA3_9TREM|nr:cytochrome c oxidase subunit III [Tamerlania zarudnyi]QRV61239.1 cytochrome c oxidase subunit III [Tamerlania zarudnyi]
MSWVPVVFCLWIGLIVWSFFFWESAFLFAVLGLCVWSLFLLVNVMCRRYTVSFVIFVLSETLFFFTAVYVVLVAEREFFIRLSDWAGYPLMGSFLLLGSSVTAAMYHSGLGRKYDLGMFRIYGYLKYTIVLGCCFVLVQLREFYVCFYDCTFDAFYTACFFLVGLHFLHVLVGLLGLCVLWRYGHILDFYHINVIIWYWHFVDYMWLVVYGVVYLT